MSSDSDEEEISLTDLGKRKGKAKGRAQEESDEDEFEAKPSRPARKRPKPTIEDSESESDFEVRRRGDARTMGWAGGGTRWWGGTVRQSGRRGRCDGTGVDHAVKERSTGRWRCGGWGPRRIRGDVVVWAPGGQEQLRDGTWGREGTHAGRRSTHQQMPLTHIVVLQFFRQRTKEHAINESNRKPARGIPFQTNTTGVGARSR